MLNPMHLIQAGPRAGSKNVSCGVTCSSIERQRAHCILISLRSFHSLNITTKTQARNRVSVAVTMSDNDRPPASVPTVGAMHHQQDSATRLRRLCPRKIGVLSRQRSECSQDKTLGQRLGQSFNSAGIALFFNVLLRDRSQAIPHLSVPDIRAINWAALREAGTS